MLHICGTLWIEIQDFLLHQNYLKKDTNGAIQAINQAIHNSHGNLPQIVYTDSLKAYREGVSQTLCYKVDHIAKCGITKPHANNNRVERLNGTLRERVKIQREWKNPKSVIVAEGQRIYYNFIKPHQALKVKHQQIRQELKLKLRINGKVYLKIFKILDFILLVLAGCDNIFILRFR